MIDFDIQQVMEYLPHRYPFLLVDRVTACEPDDYLTGLKNVSFNEPYFQGHFPKHPVMPGVLILEALAQATGLLSFCTMEKDGQERDKLYMLVGIDKARFRGQVVPGDQLILDVKLKRNMRGIGMFSGKASVNGDVVAECELMCSAQDKNF
ncbi:MAG: 3-hydroxyacyl-ACP dehydratase FabZ [Gammaproteobacteria bacterium]|nr:3-hydroxyacyl-ACP dehydratase FabZ [Gammaproteobacteria bacterium]